MTCEVIISGRLSTSTISCPPPHQREVERRRRADAAGSSDDRHLHGGHRPASERKKSNDLLYRLSRVAGQTVRDATFDVFREYGLTTLFANPGLDRDPASHRPAGRPPLRARAPRELGRRHGDGLGDRARRAGARDPAHDRRASATRSARSPPRASTARRSSSSSASRTAATSRPSRSSRAGCRAWRATTRSGSTSPCAPRTCPARSRAPHHEAVTGRGPALVIVPMDDWAAEAADPRRARRAAPRRSRPGGRRRRRRGARGAPRGRGEPGARRRGRGRRPRDLGGARRARRAARAARSGRSRSAPAPASRRTTRCSPATCRPTGCGCAQALAPHDVVLAVGAPVFRQYPFVPGPFVEPGTRVAMVSRDAAEVHRSTADLAVLAAPGPVCARARAGRPGPRDGACRRRSRFRPLAEPPAPRASRFAPPTSSARSQSACRATRS